MSKKRSANGQGTFRKRSNGTWEFRVTTEDGSQKSFYGSKQSTARQKYEDWLAGENRIEKVRTVAQWAPQWLELYKKPSVCYGTYRNYEMYTENYIIPFFNNTKLDEVRPAHIKKFFSQINDLSLSAKKHIYYAVKGIFDSAVENRMCSRSPVTEFKMPRKERMAAKDIQVFTPDEVQQIITKAPTVQYGHYVLLLLYTGLRMGELLALQWTDINDDIITVRRSLARSEDGHANEATKSGKSRFVGVTNNLKNILDTIPKESLYVIWDNGQLTPNQFSHRYKVALKEIGVDYLSPHKCRHTYATYLVRGGADLRSVQTLLGHSSLDVTEIYTHVNVDDIKRNVVKLGY